jgi:hypothetical protein
MSRGHQGRRSADIVAKVGGGHLERNNRITANQFLNQHCASGLDLESILLARVRKIFLQQYLPKGDIP